MLRNTKTSWGSAARAFHWIMGVLILGMLAYGLWMNHVPARPDRLFHRSIHADFGYVVLVLLTLRLIWRLLNPTPALPPATPIWERTLARFNHGALYIMTFLVAMLGWAHSGAHKPDYASWFGLFRVPQFTTENKADARLYEDWHIYMAYVLLALIVLHVAQALYHHFYRRDRLLVSMVDGKAG